MESPRSILATNDPAEALGASERLEAAGVESRVVLSAPGSLDNRYDPECGVDPYYQYNVVVPREDEGRALAVLAPLDHGEALAPSLAAEAPTSPYDQAPYVALRIVLVVGFFLNLPRALLLASERPSLPERYGLGALALGLWLAWWAGLWVAGGWMLAAAFLVLGVVIGVADLGFARSRFALVFVVVQALVLGSVVSWDGLP